MSLMAGPKQVQTKDHTKQDLSVAYEAVPASLKETVIKPGDANYNRAKSTFFRGGAPGIVFRVTNTQQVVEALTFARSHLNLSLIHISEPTRLLSISYAVFCL